MVLCGCHHMPRKSIADVNVVIAMNGEQQDSTMVFPCQGLHVCGHVLSSDLMAVHPGV